MFQSGDIKLGSNEAENKGMAGVVHTFIEASPGLSLGLSIDICRFIYRYLLASSVFHHNFSGLRVMQGIASRGPETDLYSLQKIILIKLSHHLLTHTHIS